MEGGELKDRALHNFDTYLEYNIATQQSWRISEYAQSPSDYRKVFKALAENKLVQDLNIRFTNNSKPLFLQLLLRYIVSEVADIRLFLDALQQNTSLLSLVLDCDTEALEEQLHAMLDILSEKNQLRALFIYGPENFNEERVFASFLRFIRRSTNLVKLRVPGAKFTDENYLKVLDVLKDHELLLRTDLGETEELREETVQAIADFLKNRPAHISFECCGCDSKVGELLPEGATVQFSEERNSWPDKEKHYLEAPEKLYLEPNSPQQFWEMMPHDMLKNILYQLNAHYLMAFLKTSKVTMNLTRQWPFWKEYYLKYFGCVPDETLDIVNIYLGRELLAVKDVDQLRNVDIWKEIFKALGSTISGFDFPFNRRPLAQKMMGPVLKKYPQIVSLMSKYVSYTNGHDVCGYGAPAICSKWIYARCGFNRWYHVGFEMMPSGEVHGLFLWGSDGYLAAESDRLSRVLYVFEWLCAKDEEELQRKVVPLLEGLLGAQETQNNCYWYSRAGRKDVFEELRSELPKKVWQLSDLVDSNAHAILDTCQVTFDTCVAFTKLVEQMIQHVKDTAESAVPDYVAIKQTMPTRAELSRRYCLYDRHYSFNERSWRPEPDVVKKTAARKTRKREKKVSSSAAMLRLVRVCLNFVVMPLLKAFWRVSPEEREYRVYPHLKSYDYQTMQEKYAPVEHVSVSHAHPEAWPIIAVAVAHLLLTPLCLVLAQLMHRTWTSTHAPHTAHEGQVSESGEEFEVRLDELISALTRIGLMSPEHVAAIRKLFEKLSSLE